MPHFCPYKACNESRERNLGIYKYTVAKPSNTLPAYTQKVDTWEETFSLPGTRQGRLYLRDACTGAPAMRNLLRGLLGRGRGQRREWHAGQWVPIHHSVHRHDVFGKCNWLYRREHWGYIGKAWGLNLKRAAHKGPYILCWGTFSCMSWGGIGDFM